jgi:hypothetical protein
MLSMLETRIQIPTSPFFPLWGLYVNSLDRDRDREREREREREICKEKLTQL